MLSFLCYLLLENPRTLEKAQEEVDTVIGKRAIELDDMGKLPYIEVGPNLNRCYCNIRTKLSLCLCRPVFAKHCASTLLHQPSL